MRGFSVAKNEFKRSLKSKRKLVLMMIIPLIAVIAALGVNNMMKPSINIGVLGNQQKIEELKNNIKDMENINIKEANKNTINTDMILAKYMGVVKFENNGDLTVQSLDKNMKTMMEESIKEVVNENKTTKFENILAILNKGNLTSGQRGIGFIFMTFMITTIMSAITIVKDREDNIIMRYKLANRDISSYILGKFMYSFGIATVQILGATLMLGLLKVNIGISLIAFMIVGILVVFLTSSLTTLIAVNSKSELQGSLLTSSIALLLGLFGGAFLPIDKMPDLLKVISEFSVVSWLMEITSSLSNPTNISFIGIGIIIVASTTFLVASIKVGNRKF